MLLIGIVGGVASGKSTVSNCFAKHGAAVLDADRAGHEVLREPAVMEAIRQRWGEQVFDVGGNIARPAVAAIVFAKGGGVEKRFLEELTHPRIGKRLQEQSAELARKRVPVAILDAALLFESGWSSLCGTVVFVDVPRDVRLDRVLGRGWSEADFRSREDWQWPAQEKRRWADFIVDNSGSLERTSDQVRAIWQQLRKERFHEASLPAS